MTSPHPESDPPPASRRSAAFSVLQLFAVLGVIAVPAFGWFGQHWSGATTVVVYWFENVATCLLLIARIALHQRLNPRSGHFRYRGPGSAGPTNSSFLAGFARISLVFCAAHGVFLGAVLAILIQNDAPQLALIDLDWRAVWWGCLGVLCFLAIAFVGDLVNLRRWTFRDLEQSADAGIGRVMVVHMTLLLGFAGIAATDSPTAFFAVFIVLKSLAALSTVVPQWEPETAPRGLSNVMNRLPNVHPGERFEDVWAKDRAAERDRRRRNEQPWHPAR